MHRVTATIMVSDHIVPTDRDIWPYAWRSHGHPTNRRTRDIDTVNARQTPAEVQKINQAIQYASSILVWCCILSTIQIFRFCVLAHSSYAWGHMTPTIAVMYVANPTVILYTLVNVTLLHVNDSWRHDAWYIYVHVGELYEAWELVLQGNRIRLIVLQCDCTR